MHWSDGVALVRHPSFIGLIIDVCIFDQRNFFFGISTYVPASVIDYITLYIYLPTGIQNLQDNSSTGDLATQEWKL